MKVTESFLVNTDNFDAIIEALRDNKDIKDKVNEALFTSLGFHNPSDLLVLHLLKALKIIGDNGERNELFAKLQDPDTTKEAIAEGIINAYGGLFERSLLAHKLSASELKEEFSAVFDNRKTDLILKYMAGTFQELAAYAGASAVEKARDRVFGSAEEAMQESTEIEMNKNGVADSKLHANSIDGDFVSTVRKEEKGTKSIEEVVSGKQESEDQEDSFEDPFEDSVMEKESKVADKKENVDTEDIFDEDDEEDETEVEGTASADDEVEENENEYDEDDESFDVFEDEDKNKRENKVTTPEKITTEAMTLSNNQKVQKALVKKSDLLYKLGRHEETLPTLKEIISYFDDSDDSFLQKAVSRSVIRRATILQKLNRHDEALPALDEVIYRFEDDDNVDYYDHASRAMLSKAEILEDKGKSDDQLPLYSKIVNRLGESNDYKVRSQVDKIYLKRIDLIAREGDYDEVLDAIEEVMPRYEDSHDTLHYLEEVMYKKAEILEQLNRDEEALDAYSEFLEKFGQEVNA